jgi:hypothetical protein
MKIFSTAVLMLFAFACGPAAAQTGLIDEFRGAVFKYDPKRITSIV